MQKFCSVFMMCGDCDKEQPEGQGRGRKSRKDCALSLGVPVTGAGDNATFLFPSLPVTLCLLTVHTRLFFPL